MKGFALLKLLLVWLCLAVVPAQAIVQQTAVLNDDPVNEAIMILLPDDYASRTLHICIYHHGAGENFSSILLDEKDAIVEALTDAGWMVIASNAFGDNCGNDASLEHYDDIIDYAIATYTTSSKVVLWSQSFGGISGLLQFAGGRAEIKGWFGAYPACSSPWMYNHGFGSLYNSAYGISTVGQIPAGKDPVSLAASLFDRKRMLFFHSPDDTVVTKADNTDAMRTLVTGHAQTYSLITGTGEHGESYPEAAPVLAFCTLCVSEIIPVDRLIDWTPGTHTGVIGGIPTDRSNFYNVTEAPYFADSTGATDAQPAIQQAIDDAFSDPECEGIYCPAGTYRLDGTLYLNHGFSNRTFLGDGSGLTIFMDQWGAPFVVGTASGTTDFGQSFADRTITAGNTKGSTTITIAGSTSAFAVGGVIVIQFEKDDDFPNLNVGSADVWTEQSGVTQAVRVVSKTSDTLTFFPPLYETRTGTAVIKGLAFQADSIGLEGFTVDCTNSTALRAVYLANCWGSWIKDVEVVKAANYGIQLENCMQSEVRQAFVRDGKQVGTNGGGILCGMWSCLIVDSIATNTFPMIEVNGSSGNAFLYNFTGDDSQTNVNHGPFNRFNLYEGNSFAFALSDGYFGGEGPAVWFRNFFYHDVYNGLNFRRGSRNISIKGNILNVGPLGLEGYPNIGNTLYSGTAQLSLGDPWKDFGMTGALTTRTSDNGGTITLDKGDLYYSEGTVHNFSIYWGTPPSNSLTCTVTAYNDGTKVVTFTTAGTLPAADTEFIIGPGSFYSGDPATSTFQELDLDVAETTLEGGNYFVNLDVFTSLQGETLEDSIAYPEQPDWWPEGFVWPPYDPENPEGVSIEMIPAGARYLQSLEDGAGTINATNMTIGTGTVGSKVSWGEAVSGNRPGRRISSGRSRRARRRVLV